MPRASSSRPGPRTTCRGRDDLDDTIARLAAYVDAGADVAYAPGLADLVAITRVVAEAGAPVNVLLRPGGPTVGDLAAAGVRRISVGGTLARVAYGALVRSAEALLAAGTLGADLRCSTPSWPAELSSRRPVDGMLPSPPGGDYATVSTWRRKPATVIWTT